MMPSDPPVLKKSGGGEASFMACIVTKATAARKAFLSIAMRGSNLEG
jgi:hypothetical protein